MKSLPVKLQQNLVTEKFIFVQNKLPLSAKCILTVLEQFRPFLGKDTLFRSLSQMKHLSPKNNVDFQGSYPRIPFETNCPAFPFFLFTEQVFLRGMGGGRKSQCKKNISRGVARLLISIVFPCCNLTSFKI